MTTKRNLIAEADIYLDVSGSAEAGEDTRMLALRQCRLVFDAAAESMRQIELLLVAREREAVRVAKSGGAT